MTRNERDDWPAEIGRCKHCGLPAVLLCTTQSPYWHGSKGCPLDGWHGQSWEWEDENKDEVE